MSNVPYASVVRSLMYAMLCTRADNYFSVVLVYCYQNNIGLAHCHAVNRIMCYLHSIVDLILCNQGGNLKLGGYLYVD